MKASFIKGFLNAIMKFIFKKSKAKCAGVGHLAVLFGRHLNMVSGSRFITPRSQNKNALKRNIYRQIHLVILVGYTYALFLVPAADSVARSEPKSTQFSEKPRDSYRHQSNPNTAWKPLIPVETLAPASLSLFRDVAEPLGRTTSLASSRPNSSQS